MNKDKINDKIKRIKDNVKKRAKAAALFVALSAAILKPGEIKAQDKADNNKKVYTQEQVQSLKQSQDVDDQLFLEVFAQKAQERQYGEKMSQDDIDQIMMKSYDALYPEKANVRDVKYNELKTTVERTEQDGVTRVTTTKTGTLSTRDYNKQEQEDYRMLKAALDFRSHSMGGSTVPNQTRVMTLMAELRGSEADRETEINKFLERHKVSAEKQKDGNFKFSTDVKGKKYTQNYQTLENMAKSLEKHGRGGRR